MSAIKQGYKVNDTISIIEKLDYETIIGYHIKPVCRIIKVCAGNRGEKQLFHKSEAGCTHKRVCIGVNRLNAIKVWCLKNKKACKKPNE